MSCLYKTMQTKFGTSYNVERGIRISLKLHQIQEGAATYHLLERVSRYKMVLPPEKIVTITDAASQKASENPRKKVFHRTFAHQTVESIKLPQ